MLHEELHKLPKAQEHALRTGSHRAPGSKVHARHRSLAEGAEALLDRVAQGLDARTRLVRDHEHLGIGNLAQRRPVRQIVCQEGLLCVDAVDAEALLDHIGFGTDNNEHA